MGGLGFASEVWPLDPGRGLNALERKRFRDEIGCQPLLLCCHACGAELSRIRQSLGDQSTLGNGPLAREVRQQEKEVQAKAALIMEILVEAGADALLPDVGPMGNTSLHLAAKYGAAHLLSTIVRTHGQLVPVPNKEGVSAELIAQQARHILCAQILQVVAAEQQQQALAEVVEMANREADAAAKM